MVFNKFNRHFNLEKLNCDYHAMPEKSLSGREAPFYLPNVKTTGHFANYKTDI